MQATRYELKPVEKMIGGGVVTLFLGRRSRSPNGAQTDTPQALTASQQLTLGDADVCPVSPNVSYESAASTGEGSAV